MSEPLCLGFLRCPMEQCLPLRAVGGGGGSESPRPPHLPHSFSCCSEYYPLPTSSHPHTLRRRENWGQMSTRRHGISHIKNLYARSCAEPLACPKLPETLALDYSHLTDENIEALGREVICLWSKNLSQNLNPGLSDSGVCPELRIGLLLESVCHSGYLDTVLGSPSSLD